MFVHMVLVGQEKHEARGAKYDLLVYRVLETGEFRIYIAKGGFGVGDIFTASQEIVLDAKRTAEMDVVSELIANAKGDIDRNEYGQY